MENYSSQHADIFYDDKLDALALVFKEVASLDQFVTLNQQVLNIFKTLQTNRFYVDTRKIGVVSPEGQKWMVDHLFLGMIRHISPEPIYHAQIIPKSDIFGRFASENIRKNAQKKYESKQLLIKAFESEYAGKIWLASQPKLDLQA